METELTPYYSDHLVTLYNGDALEILKMLPDELIQTVVTSPPYWSLRDYGVDGQLGLEKTPDEYVAKIVEIFNEIKRVLKKDGTVWLNMGDCYISSPNPDTEDRKYPKGRKRFDKPNTHKVENLKIKNLVGMPWRVAFALQNDGWYLRSDIIWAKKNYMPESVKDRPTKSHEYIFLLSKSHEYHYDCDSIREPLKMNRWSKSNKLGSSGKNIKNLNGAPGQTPHSFQRKGHSGYYDLEGKPLFHPEGRNKNTVWYVGTKPYSGAHFATFPPELITPCIKAGCPERGIVLDPFGGSGTTADVAKKLNRKCISIELKTEYCELHIKRWQNLELDL